MANITNTTARLLLAAVIVMAELCHGIADDLPTRSRLVAGKVQVTLRSRVAVDADVISISDVAMVTGGDTELREYIKSLDVEEAVDPGEILTITPTQIEFRLRLAGVGSEEVAVRGSAVRVTLPTEVKNVSATFHANISQRASGTTTRRTSTEANESIPSTNSTRLNAIASAKATAERRLSSSQADAKAVLVKRFDRVRLIAKTGTVSIVTVGEAQQDGREGEMIRVLNASTKTALRGRVTGVNEVEISF